MSSSIRWRPSPRYCPHLDIAKQIQIIINVAKPRPNHPQPLLHYVQRYVSIRIMLDGQSLIGARVHPLWFDAMPVQDARFPFQAIPDFVCPARRTAIQIFPLASIG